MLDQKKNAPREWARGAFGKPTVDLGWPLMLPQSLRIRAQHLGAGPGAPPQADT